MKFRILQSHNMDIKLQYLGSFRHKLSRSTFVLVLQIWTIRTMYSIDKMFLFHGCEVGVRLSYLNVLWSYGLTIQLYLVTHELMLKSPRHFKIFLESMSFHQEDKIKHLNRNFDECDINIDFEYTYMLVVLFPYFYMSLHLLE